MALTSASEGPGWQDRLKKLDRVWLAIALLVAGLFAWSAELGLEVSADALANLWSTAPFLLVSVAIAAYAGASGADALIARAFSGRVPVMIGTASLFGALSPFCSCGVIPIIAALLSMGVPLAPVMAFWLASPVMDPSMFVMTSAVLGVDFAIAKLLAAIGLGLLGGFGIYVLMRMNLFTDPLREGVGNGGCGAASVRERKPVHWRFWETPDRVEKFRKSAIRNTLFLGKWLLLAFVLEALMVRYIPAETVAELAGGDGWLPILAATFVGIPAYLNGFAALPLVDGLLQQGMAAGPALTFMVAGGVTCIPAAVAVFALVKKPVFLTYVVFALSGSFVAGLLFQAIAG